MNVTPQEYIDEARSWVGTPFAHRGRMKGSAVDCIGVAYCVARKFDMVPVEAMVTYSRDPSGNLLHKSIGKYLMRVHPPYKPGDLLVFRFVRDPQHVAVFTGKNLIHAYSEVGKCIEHRFDKKWQKRLTGAFRFEEFE